MKIGSLFSGYGGLDLGVQSVLGGEVVWHVEYDKAPSRILAHHWPEVPNFGDVTAVDFTQVEPVDVLTGGYPCQPFSHAGNRKGTNDERHLWPHVLRAISDMAPRIVILENVRGHLTLGFDTVLADLADVGWSAEWGIVRASDTGAPHQRARLFIVAYPERQGQRAKGLNAARSQESTRASGDAKRRGGEGLSTPADTSSQRHGPRQDARGLGHLDSQDAGSPWEWERSWEVFGDRGPAPTADATGNGRPPRGTGSSEWPGTTGQPASDHGPTADAAGAGRVRAPQHEDDGADSGRGRRHDSPDMGQGRCDFAPDPDVAGGQAWGTEPRREGRQSTAGQRESVGGDAPTSWGDYGPAITRWEHLTGRPAPAPTEPGRTGAPRLSPAFVEWMMGLPAGWVTDPAIGISRNDQLKALGNGVVPQQAALALSLLRDQMAVAA